MTASASPSLDAYIASLPHGLDSYAGCQQKAVVLRQFLPGHLVREVADLVPKSLVSLVEDPPPVTEWVSEVKATAIYLALRDTMSTEDAFVDFAHTMNRRLMSSPVYRILYALVSPERILRGCAARWGQMHRGTELRPQRVADGEAILRLSFPQMLVPHVLARAYATAYRAALELSGAKDISVECRDASSTGYTFVASWK